MANPTRIRKRVQAIRRAPDGSAFQNCGNCGVSVPISLADMHDCKTETKSTVKRFKGINGKQYNIEKLSFSDDDQPRSPFLFFMEEFVSYFKDGNLIDINKEVFEIWKKMSNKERQPYAIKAEKVEATYVARLNREIDDSHKVDEEADSAMVGKFDPVYMYYDDGCYSSARESESFYS